MHLAIRFSRDVLEQGVGARLRAMRRAPLHRLLAAASAGQLAFQFAEAVDALAACLAEQHQRQFGGDQRVGTGVVALLHLQAELGDPLIQSALTHACLRAEQGAISATSKKLCCRR